jgi:hypothetical protein
MKDTATAPTPKNADLPKVDLPTPTDEQKAKAHADALAAAQALLASAGYGVKVPKQAMKQFACKVPETVSVAFNAACKAKGLTAAEVANALLAEYVAKNS